MRPQVINSEIKRSSFYGKVIRALVFAMIITALVILTGSLYLKDTVYIVDNGIEKEVKTNLTSVNSILKEAGYTLGEKDITRLEKNENGEEVITILRAVDVKITADGKTSTVKVSAGTVGEALAGEGIELGEFDTVNVALDKEVYGGMKIKVTRVSYATRELDETIPCETEYIDNINRVIGDETVISKGEDGYRHIIYRDKIVNGEVAESEIVSQEVYKEAVNAVVERGTALKVPYAKTADISKVELVDGIPAEYTRVISGKATAYQASPGSLTASGRYARVGTIAVNPNIIPYGSEVYIVARDGSRVYGYAIAADSGDGMMEQTVAVDVFMACRADSCRWGAVYVDIYILKEGDNVYQSKPC